MSRVEKWEPIAITIAFDKLEQMIRADEREKIAQAIEGQATPHCDDYDRSCACAGCTAHDEAMDAARIAREATRGEPPEST